MPFRASITGQNFDSFFDRANGPQPARIRIQLKVTLVPLDPSTAWARSSHSAPLPADMPSATIPPDHLAPDMSAIKRGNVADANGQAVACRSWLVSEWSEFVTRFKQSVEHAWNNQMIFLPTESGVRGDELSDDDFRMLIGNPRLPAHAAGALEIEVQPKGTIGHAIIEVAHLQNPGATFRARMTRISDESVLFKHHTFVYGRSRGVEGETGQITAAHEVGHWLRDPTTQVNEHIDRAHSRTVPAAQRGKAQYGKTLGRYHSLMGGGSVVGEHEAQPFIARLRRHSPMKLGWSLMHRIHFQQNLGKISDRQRRLTRP
jgi:hypothetical protein